MVHTHQYNAGSVRGRRTHTTNQINGRLDLSDDVVKGGGDSIDTLLVLTNQFLEITLLPLRTQPVREELPRLLKGA